MSLTTFIENHPDVRTFLRETFPKPRTERPKALVAPPLSRNYSLVGTAFDYLCRWQLEILHESRRSSRWVAESAIERLGDPQRRLSAGESLATAQRIYQTGIKKGRLSASHAKSAIELARLDVVFRSGKGEEQIGKPVERADVQDLLQLLAVLRSSQLARLPVRLFNPTFTSGELVGGADADLVVGDALVDIKVTKDPKVWREHFNQVLGYYLLLLNGGFEDVRRQPRIRRLGIYMARFGHLVLWRIEDIGTARQFARAAKAFEDRARLQRALYETHRVRRSLTK